MKYLFKIKKGDISLLVTLMVCSIMLIYLAPISQKLSVESKISRENLMSQQAIQAAKTGLEHWVYDIEERATSNVINFNFSGNDKNVPQNLTSWESLDSNLGIEYRVDFFPKNGSKPAYIVSRGRVNRNGFTVERTFEEKFQSSSDVVVAFTCPTGYIRVPGNSLYGTNDFCVMKYEAKTGSETVAATTQEIGLPQVWINQTNAISSCSLNGPGYGLINNNEWMTIARNIEAQNINWRDGTIGSTDLAGGGLWSGHSDGVPYASLAASTDDNPYFGTDNSGTSRQRRTHTLSNGEVIWDLSGNVWEWTNDTILGKDQPTGSITGFALREYKTGLSNSITNFGALSRDLVGPSNSSWGIEQNLGALKSYGTSSNNTNYGFLRGGEWFDGLSGVFYMTLDATPGFSWRGIGFRCVLR